MIWQMPEVQRNQSPHLKQAGVANDGWQPIILDQGVGPRQETVCPAMLIGYHTHGSIVASYMMVDS
ncbi:MAG: hypothetical protein CCU26_02750 [Nitrospira sp. UW-LDO-01]|nr:MAG: hypothetical protein CCU26_02750 [Nitrospira sp. UW-LDO-01]